MHKKPNEFINFIQQFERAKTFKKVIIRLDLSQVLFVDIAAITFLLAKINEFLRVENHSIFGILPKDTIARRIFQNSAFLSYMRDLQGDIFKKNSDDFIIKVGGNRTENKLVGKTIEKSMKYLFGEEKKFQPVYGIIQEICSNSVEWANPSDSENKNWLIGVNFVKFNNEPHINFSITDVGYGIMKTLRRNFSDQIKDEINTGGDVRVLYRAFERKYGSKSKEANRNRGLPLVKLAL